MWPFRQRIKNNCAEELKEIQDNREKEFRILSDTFNKQIEIFFLIKQKCWTWSIQFTYWRMHQSLLITELIKQKEELVSLKTDYLKISDERIQKNKRIKENEAHLQDVGNNLKRGNLRVIDYEKEEERETGV